MRLEVHVSSLDRYLQQYEKFHRLGPRQAKTHRRGRCRRNLHGTPTFTNQFCRNKRCRGRFSADSSLQRGHKKPHIPRTQRPTPPEEVPSGGDRRHFNWSNVSQRRISSKAIDHEQEASRASHSRSCAWLIDIRALDGEYLLGCGEKRVEDKRRGGTEAMRNLIL